MKIQKFTSKGVKVGEVLLPKEIGMEVNLPLLAQAVYVYENRAHVGLRKTKTRAEINRTTKKVYRQKGTGGARHGSRRANLFVGGGVALGPRPVKRELNLSNAIKAKAKSMAFSFKAGEKELIFVSGISKIIKTKEAGELLKALKKEVGGKKFTFVLSEKAKDVSKFLKNLDNTSYVFYKDVNAYDIYKGGIVILDENVFISEKSVKMVEKKVTETKKVATKKTVKVVKKEIKK